MDEKSLKKMHIYTHTHNFCSVRGKKKKAGGALAIYSDQIGTHFSGKLDSGPT